MRIPAPVTNLRAALKVSRSWHEKPADVIPEDDGIVYDEQTRRRTLRGVDRLTRWAFAHADKARRLT